MAEDKPARYEGAYVPRISQDEIDAVYEQASMQPRFDHPAPGKAVPTVRDVTRDARKEAEDKEEPMYGGVYVAKEVGLVDTRPIIDKKCHVNCKNMWDEYEKCEKRIEAKGTGDCSSWYMDYLRCIDGCASKVLFNTLA